MLPRGGFRVDPAKMPVVNVFSFRATLPRNSNFFICSSGSFASLSRWFPA
jgi:hypothetical protein